jgi:hypothetical protein
MVRISPDGTKVALVLGTILGGPRPAIWLFDQRTKNLSLLTGDPAGDDGPVWSADGRRIFFRSLRGDPPGVYAIELETGETKPLALSSLEFRGPLPWTISPDDRTLGLLTFVTDVDIITLSLADGLRGCSTTGNHRERAVLFPERRMARIPRRAGRWHRRDRYPAVPGRLAYSDPRRSRCLACIFTRWVGAVLFRRPGSFGRAGHLRADTPRRGAAETLRDNGPFPERTRRTVMGRRPECERFLMIRAPSAAAGGTEPKIDVVVNWFEELKSRVPTQ